jgi:hypothetical protein
VRVNRGTGDRLVGVSVRVVSVNKGTGDRLVGVSVRGVRVNRITGNRLVGVIVKFVRVNTHLSVVMRLRAPGAVIVRACRGRNFPQISCQNSTSGDVSRPVIDICCGVQFVVDRNTER